MCNWYSGLKTIVKALLFTGLFFVNIFAFSQEDSLRKIAEGNTHDTNRIKAYFLWDDLIYFSDPKLDLKINLKIEELSEKGLLGKASNSEKKFFKTSLAKAKNNLGMIYFDRGDYKKAIHLHSESLELNEDLKDDAGSALTLGNLANIYYQLDELDKALEYYAKNLKLAKKSGNLNMQSTTLNNIANIYADKKKFDQALFYYRESLTQAISSGDSMNISRALNNIGTVFNDLKQFDSAFVWYEKSLRVREKLKDLKGMASSNGDIGLIYLKKNDLSNALNYLKQGEKYAVEAEDVMDLMNISKTLYYYYDKTGDSKNALRYFVQFINLKDSISSDENTRASIQREYKYNYEKQAQIERIKTEQQKRVDAAVLEESKAKVAQKEILSYALFGGLGLVIIFLFYVINRYTVVRNQKNIIELKEKETKIQKDLIEEKQKEILDSITYAKRIQDAILPSENSWFSHFPDSFILYKPKDIIAGDFYFLEHHHNFIFAAVADCTGHGVPGAMVSVVCSTALSKSILEYNLENTGEILDHTREMVAKQFAKAGENVRDGMDISFCKFDFSTNKLFWSGANNPLIIVRPAVNTEAENELIELVPNKEPIGIYENRTPFIQHEISLQRGDMIYMFSDGYADQFGGKQKKKFRKNNLYKLLIEISKLSSEEQKNILLKTHTDWKGDTEQIDDLCIIGVKV
jgi:serine phosphatase RsbU (regulator of sigma subunit)/Tfp pilus assembly protein PilF